MKTESNQTRINYTEQIIGQVLATWTSRNKAFSDFFNKYDDNAYLSEIAPDRNRAVYLLGHLIATNDSMIPLLGLGEKLFPELEPFSRQPDKSFELNYSVNDLKLKWETLNEKLTNYFTALSPAEWMDRHTAVSPEDFIREPQRNRLNVLLGRTNHQSYHLGQLNLLKVSALVA